MSQKVLIATREEAGVTYGRVVKATEHMLIQDFAHTHVEHIVRDKLMRNATQAESSGFNYTLPGGMAIAIAEGHAIDVQGRSYDTLPAGATTQITIPAAHVSLPRIDLLFATVVADQDEESGPLPFRRLLSTSEQAAGDDPYPINNENVNTRRDNVAVVGVRQGVANASPAAPALGANEIPLYQVRVDAGVTAIVSNKVTDVRRQMKSLADALVRLDTLEASPAIASLQETVEDYAAGLIVDSVSLTKNYNDAAGQLTLDVDTAWLTEQVDDRFAALFSVTSNTGLSGAYNDAGNSYALAGVAASGSVMGMMPAADKAKLDAATSGSTPNTLVARDGGGGAGFTRIKADPLVTSDLYPNQKSAVHATIALGNGSTALYGYSEAGVANGDVAFGAFLHANANRASFVAGTTSYALYTETGGGASRWAAYLNGNTHVVGTLTAGSKSFMIDHPLDPLGKTLMHGVVEMNGNGLLYPVQVTLEEGAAEISLDEALGMTVGTLKHMAQRLMVMSLYSDGTARVSAQITETVPVGDEEPDTRLVLSSEDETDASTVNVLVIGHRADNYIKATPYVDVDGLLILEHDKPELTVEDEEQLTPAHVGVPEDSPLLGTTRRETLPHLIGKAGYLLQAEAVGGTVPARSVAFVSESVEAAYTMPAGAGADDSGTGTRAWDDAGGIVSEGGGLPAHSSIGVSGSPVVTTHYLLATNCDFDIPPEKTLLTILVEIKRQCSQSGGTTTITDAALRLVKGGAVQTEDRADTGATWPKNTFGVATYQFSGSDLDGLTVADVNAADFGVALAATFHDPNDDESAAAEVDFIRITVYTD